MMAANFTEGVDFAYVDNLYDFENLNTETLDYLFGNSYLLTVFFFTFVMFDVASGTFERSHMQYDLDRPLDRFGEPSLADMVQTAIEILNKDEDGYFLFVEGGRIDHAHHSNNAIRAMQDTVALSDAVQRAMDLTDSVTTSLSAV